MVGSGGDADDVQFQQIVVIATTGKKNEAIRTKMFPMAADESVRCGKENMGILFSFSAREDASPRSAEKTSTKSTKVKDLLKKVQAAMHRGTTAKERGQLMQKLENTMHVRIPSSCKTDALRSKKQRLSTWTHGQGPARLRESKIATQ